MSLAEFGEDLLVFELLALFAAAAIAAAWRSPPQRRAHAKGMELFEAGKRGDPRRMAFGPHKSWRENFRLFAAAFCTMAFVWVLLTALGGGHL